MKRESMWLFTPAIGEDYGVVRKVDSK